MTEGTHFHRDGRTGRRVVVHVEAADAWRESRTFAKAMVVTPSRLHAVRYKRAFDKYISDQGYNDVGVLVAFSGVVKDPDVENVDYTEVGMNIDPKTKKGIKEGELPEKFDSDQYQVLLVANKYQTGFDQPLLHTMYVDKRLSGVQAVQTLSRLNRMTAGKEDTFVLDFVNDADEIQRSFQPYYEQTVVAERRTPTNSTSCNTVSRRCRSSGRARSRPSASSSTLRRRSRPSMTRRRCTAP